MKSRSERIQLIKTLAQQKQDESVRAFGQCMDKLNQLQIQLDKLYQYREDYNQQFKQQAEKGVPVTNLQDFLRFINSLSHNIDILHENLKKQRETCEKLKHIWLEKRQKVQILDSVKHKYLRQEQQQLEKKEQKINDEAALSFVLRKENN